MSSAGTTLTILDELADRERRHKNLIVYNLAESSESLSDQSKLQELCSSVFKVDMTLTKTVCLVQKRVLNQDHFYLVLMMYLSETGYYLYLESYGSLKTLI